MSQYSSPQKWRKKLPVPSYISCYSSATHPQWCVQAGKPKGASHRNDTTPHHSSTPDSLGLSPAHAAVQAAALGHMPSAKAGGRVAVRTGPAWGSIGEPVLIALILGLKQILGPCCKHITPRQGTCLVWEDFNRMQSLQQDAKACTVSIYADGCKDSA